MLEKIIAKLKELGLIPADKEKDITTALSELKLDKEVDTSKITDPQLKAYFDALNAQLTKVSDDNKTLAQLLAEEKTARENAVNAAKATAEAQKKEAAEKLVNEALKNGKIVEADKQKYIDRAIADLDATKEAVERFATVPGFKPTGGDNQQQQKAPVSAIRGPLASADKTVLKAMNEMSNKTE